MTLHNLTDLANVLRSIDNDKPLDGEGFDMHNDWITRKETEHSCGSACCIGGWVQHHNPETFRDQLGVVGAVATLLPTSVDKGDIIWDELHELCYPYTYLEAWDATPQQAARAVEILRDTGKCDWERAMSEETN